MKKHICLLPVCLLASMILFGQGNGKGNAKAKKNSTTSTTQPGKISSTRHDQIIWEGTKDNDGGRPKPSKNQPAKVRAAFQKDYPYASNVAWRKYRGDWTARFINGPFISTAVYHANGDRRDTRTSLLRSQIPQIIIEGIFKKIPGVDIGVGVKLEIPNVIKDIFRIRTVSAGITKYLFYNSDGNEVQYNY